MFKKVCIYNFSGIYEKESFYRTDKGSSFIDCKDISGTNCMCDDLAVEKIREIIRENISEDAREDISEDISESISEKFEPVLNFIDSGNYHYMSALLTERVKEPFSLIVLDHHPDMQRPMFGDILSCGGWVMKVLENNPYVREIHVIGADRGLISELPQEDREKAFFYDLEDMDKVSPKYPVYLSVDKDVMKRSELVTNWDQGEMSASELLSFVKRIVEEHRILGIDICGECAIDQEDCNLDEAISGNDDFNGKVMDMLLASALKSV